MQLSVLFCLGLVGQSGADLDFAEELYLAAQYEAAAEKLGASCAGSIDPARWSVTVAPSTSPSVSAKPSTSTSSSIPFPDLPHLRTAMTL